MHVTEILQKPKFLITKFQFAKVIFGNFDKLPSTVPFPSRDLDNVNRRTPGAITNPEIYSGHARNISQARSMSLLHEMNH